MSVQTSRVKDVAILRLDRPDVLNALDQPIVDGISAALERLRGEPLQGLVLSGSGGAFCSGANVRAMAEMDQPAFRIFIETIQEGTRLLRSLPFPTVAAIERVAVGGGLELAIACDFRVASSSARFSFPEVRRGLVVTSGASRLLPLHVGLPAARRLLFLEEQVDAEEARAIGLIDEICGDGSAEQRALGMLERLGEASAGAVVEMRDLLDAGLVGDLDEVYRREVEAIVRSFGQPDAEEGLRAFAERRPPRFGGSPPAILN